MASSARPGPHRATRQEPGAGPGIGRGRVRGRGLIDGVTIQPRSAAPRFTAIVRIEGDPRLEGARVRLVWMGQRRVPGIEPGAEIAFEGMASAVEGLPTVYNPRYEIIGRPEAP